MQTPGTLTSSRQANSALGPGSELIAINIKKTPFQKEHGWNTQRHGEIGICFVIILKSSICNQMWTLHFFVSNNEHDYLSFLSQKNVTRISFFLKLNRFQDMTRFFFKLNRPWKVIEKIIHRWNVAGKALFSVLWLRELVTNQNNSPSCLLMDELSVCRTPLEFWLDGQRQSS